MCMPQWKVRKSLTDCGKGNGVAVLGEGLGGGKSGGCW
jgi:hypothetical protein